MALQSGIFPTILTRLRASHHQRFLTTIVSSELAGICVRNAQFMIDCNYQPLQGEEHFAGILFVQGSRLVPDSPS